MGIIDSPVLYLTLPCPQVTVRVLDINDNAPQFSSELYVFSARENTSSPITVGSTTAMDIDTGEYIYIAL